jgi:MFS family permease
VYSPIVGWFSDGASSRKGLYLIGLFALILSTFFVAVARVYWILLIARILQRCLSAIVWTVGIAVLADTMPTEQLGIAMGTIGSVVSLAMVSAPVLGGTV